MDINGLNQNFNFLTVFYWNNKCIIFANVLEDQRNNNDKRA